MLWIAVRVSLITMILSAGNRIEVPTNQYEMVLEYAYSITQSQLLMNFFNILMCLIRMFKFYRFQPRLAVVNQTLQKSGPDLFHFLLMFLTFIYGFAVITNILFGPQLIFFSNMPESMATTFTYMLTAAPNQAAMANVNGEMAVVWYLCFMLIVGVILLNVLLAILVDSYMAAKEEEEEKWKAMGYEELPSMLDQLFSLSLLRHLFAFGSIHEDLLLRTLETIKAAKEEEHGSELWSIDDKAAVTTVAEIFEAIPETVRTTGKITMEMIRRSGCIRWVEEDEELEHEMQWLDEALQEKELALAAPEEALYLRIKELAAENARLYEQHHTLVDEMFQKSAADKKQD